MYYLIAFNRETGQIEHYVSNSRTMPALASIPSYNPDMHDIARLDSPAFPISRDHKVKLDGQGSVIGTVPNPNPVQPVELEPSPDWRALWAGAANTAQKLDVIAKRLNLE